MGNQDQIKGAALSTLSNVLQEFFSSYGPSSEEDCPLKDFDFKNYEPRFSCEQLSEIRTIIDTISTTWGLWGECSILGVRIPCSKSKTGECDCHCGT